MKNILVTGGAGFIGSHTCISLIKLGFKIYIIDSFANSSPNVIEAIKKITLNEGFDCTNQLQVFKGDILDIEILEEIFSEAKNKGNSIDAVVHFAGLKSVKDSLIDPFIYWRVNVYGSFNLLSVMEKYNCNTIVFSSSATIYGNSKKYFIDENEQLSPINPYGSTKLTIEKFLNDIFISNPSKWRISSLRYFNPIGAHHSGLIGEDSKGIPNNIFPFITQVACQTKSNLRVFGNDWPTDDGTGVRDYIHIMDLADAHVRMLNYLFNSKPQNISINVGTGVGTSVLDLINAFEVINNIKIPYIIQERRDGDVARLVADNSLLKKTLDWFPKRTLNEMCRDGWNWQKLNPLGFN